MAKGRISNLDKIKTTAYEKFTNDTSVSSKTKNLLIKAPKDFVDKYKVISFDYYKLNHKLSDFSFRHYMVLALLNIEKSFKKVYGSIQEPNEDFIKFYKKRGTKAKSEKQENAVLDSLNFLLPTKYSNLYYSLMHTYYVNEKSSLPSYSISAFFEYIVAFVETHKIEEFEFSL